MKLIDILFETSPFTPKNTNEILFDNKVFFYEDEQDAFFRMLNDEFDDTEADFFIEEFCEFVNAYVTSCRGPVSYKQIIRDKMEKWCFDIGNVLHIQDDKLRKLIDTELCIPIKEELTSKVLKELHKREGISGVELARKLGVNPKTIYNEIEKIKGTKGNARIYGQQIQVPITEKYITGDSNKSHIKTFCTKNTVSPVMLQMNISQTATLLSSLAHAYLSEEKSIARTLGFEVWAQLSDYARDRIKCVYENIDEELCIFIDELSQELTEEYIVSFQTEIEAFDDLNIGEQLVTLDKTSQKCKITYMDDGLKETLYDCTVKRPRNGKVVLFKGVKEDGEIVIMEYNRGMDLRLEIY